MVKTSDKASVAALVSICYGQGLRRVIISPGSRNGPLSLSFKEHGGFDVQVIPDERAAAFMALGMSQFDKVPTILLCTSGSAVLNYAPAVAEAFYQRIPLLVISADRPKEWVDQLEGQTMLQNGVLKNFVNKEIDLPQEPSDEIGKRFHDRLVNEAIAACQYPVPAPVHLNVHLTEPLYGLTEANAEVRLIEEILVKKCLPDESLIKELLSDLKDHPRVILLMGMHSPDQALEKTLNGLSSKGWVIMNESSSNLRGDKIISCIDRCLEAIKTENEELLKPDLIISFGGPLVSKKIKQRFRKDPPKAHWHIDAHQPHIDMFQCLNKAIRVDPSLLLAALNEGLHEMKSEFQDHWLEISDRSIKNHFAFLEVASWSDMKAYSQILDALPSQARIQMANSAAVRYVQLYDHLRNQEFYANRGVSGIDGCNSTAVGMAHLSKEPVVLLTGDMAFRYDVNAFWSNQIPRGLKCIVVNNGGGGIFRIIPGPSASGHLEELFEAAMENSAEKVASLSGLPYLSAKNEVELESSLKELFADDATMVLEIFTPREENEKVLAAYFKALTS